jgi:hypothetical protein
MAAQLGDELLHPVAIGVKNRIGGADVALDLLHRHQPQQSDLNPQEGQRHTACMRYTSAPHRSQSILSLGVPGPAGTSPAPGVPGTEVSRIGVIGRREGGESGMAAIIAETEGLPGRQSSSVNRLSWFW